MARPFVEACGRCAGGVIDPSCWCMHCGAALCGQCGDRFGHCGHPKVEELSCEPDDERSRHERERLVTELARIMRALASTERPTDGDTQSARLLN